jgi:hypothetical protein
MIPGAGTYPHRANSDSQGAPRGNVMKRLTMSVLATSLAAALGPASALAEFDEGGWDETTSEAITYGMPALAFGITQWKGDKEGRNEWFWTLVATNVVHGGTKLAFKDHEWGERPGSTHRYSFPSGHAANGVAMSEFLLERYGWRYGVPAYLATGFVIWERLNDEKHHERDIYVGSAIGFIAATWITEEYVPEKAKKAGLSILPVADAGSVGVLFSFRM